MIDFKTVLFSRLCHAVPLVSYLCKVDLKREKFERSSEDLVQTVVIFFCSKVNPPSLGFSLSIHSSNKKEAEEKEEEEEAEKQSRKRKK